MWRTVSPTREEDALQQFQGKLAVLTGGGTGMGRELVRQLSADGCHVAMCDVSEDAMAETKALSEQAAPAGTKVTTFVADVSDEQQVLAFRDSVAAAHATDHIHLLFNNAGIGGGGSVVVDSREEWDKVFGVCWGGVYACTRAFLPMLLASPEGHIVNTSSVNGFWASLGPLIPHTAYSAAKFAVKGFTEALINDFRLNAPHLHASVVMPGHIGTSIVINSSRMLGRDPKELNDEQMAQLRARLARMGLPTDGASDEDIRQAMVMQAESFRDQAPMTAAQAATTILNGVREGQWRILVGEDAALLAYEPSFLDRLHAKGVFQFTP
jgi:NAD(P)-dependent dehydrogenase (short-subunit alcohol dehydrogenase family)